MIEHVSRYCNDETPNPLVNRVGINSLISFDCIIYGISIINNYLNMT